MKKLFFAIALLAVAIMVCSCGGKTVKTEQGEVTVKSTGEGGWCSEGADWSASWEVPGAEADSGTAEWKVDKLMTSGKYEGLCHVIYKVTTDEGTTTLDYYFSEDGESGYYEMVMPDGSKFSQSFGMG